MQANRLPVEVILISLMLSTLLLGNSIPLAKAIGMGIVNYDVELPPGGHWVGEAQVLNSMPEWIHVWMFAAGPSAQFVTFSPSEFDIPPGPGPFSEEPRPTQDIWIYVDVPENATTGFYEGSYNCMGGGVVLGAQLHVRVYVYDLYVCTEDIDFSNTMPAQGEQLTISATVHNSGPENATNVLVQIYDDDPSSGGLQIGGNQTVTEISAEANETVLVNWNTAGLRGRHDIYAIVDQYDEIFEASETNNKASKEITVTPRRIVVPDDYPTIQEAINAASDGDTISARNGTYYENVVVNKTLSLVGEDAEYTIIDGGEVGSVLTIATDYANVTGFTIQNSGDGYPNAGISLDGANHCYITGNNIANNEYGIYLEYSNNNTASGNNMTANDVCGIELELSYGNSIDGNNVTANNMYGILLDTSSSNSISRNNITNNREGIYLDYYSNNNNNSISGNNVTNSLAGIVLDGSSNYNISGNNIANDYYGILLDTSSSNNIDGNSITTNSGYGILLESSLNNSISGNSITNNLDGIHLDSSSSNSIFRNNFVNNNIQFDSSNSANTWDDGYPSGGNYWSDYVSSDTHSGTYQNETGSDGIGDVPYIIDSNNQDNYPLMRPYVPFENQTIYIRADGSVDPSGAPIGRMGDIYTLTGDISSAAWGIVVERDNMTLEGAGYTLEGGGNGVGVSLSGRSNVTIENATIKSFEYGTYLWNSSYSRVSENNITENGWGMMIYPHSCHSIVTRNNITHNSGDGIRTGDLSDNTTISYNYIAENLEGIYVGRSSNDTIVYNRIAANTQFGIRVDWSSHIDILQNNMTGSYDAISIWNTTNCQVLENSVKGSGCGLSIEYASAIKITQNDVSENAGGVRFVNSTDSSVVNNNFINNTLQAYTINSTVTWNSGYPSGGNCWSDYPGRDVFRGAFQNETGSDGIGDTVYEVDLANWDNYPLMKPYPWDDHGVGVTYVGRVYAFDVVVPLKTVVGLNYSMSVDTFVMNYGASAEVFNVTVYANESIIGTFENVALAAGNSTILSLRWDTAGLAYGNYTISAVASNVSGEFDLTDNIKTNGVVYVGIPGDINGDGKVDVKDVAYVARRFGQDFRDSLWNPNADMNDDGKIDVMDVAAASRHFGEHYP